MNALSMLMMTCGIAVVGAFCGNYHHGRRKAAPIVQNQNRGHLICFPSATTTQLPSSPLDDLIGNIFGKDEAKKNDSNDNSEEGKISPNSESNDDDGGDEMSLSSFQRELAKRQDKEADDEMETATNTDDDEEEFDGYALRDMIYYKYGECFDVEFQRVDSYGFRTVYLVSF